MQSLPIEYEHAVQRLYEAVLEPGATALDVGAHLGRHTFPMAERVGSTGRVLAVEPLPMCRKEIAHEAAAHPEKWKHVEIRDCALSQYEGKAEFTVAKDALAYSGLREREYDHPTRLEKIPIEVRRIDDLLRDEPRLDFIKIDAEGGEFDILRGGIETIKKHRPVVTFELGANSIGEYDFTPADMFRFWTDLGYEVYGITGIRFDSETDFDTSCQVQELWDYVALPAESPRRTKLIEWMREWHPVDPHIERVASHAHLTYEPRATSYPRPLRWLVRKAARVLMRLGRVFTFPQQKCNTSVTLALQALRDDLRKLKEESRREKERLECELARLRDRHAA